MFLCMKKAFVQKLLRNDINCDGFPRHTLFWHQMYNNLVNYDVIKYKRTDKP